MTADMAGELSGVGGVAFHDCLCLKLRMSARQVTAIYDEQLAPVGIRITQFGVLAHLSEQGAVMAVVDLAAALRMDPTTLSRNLKPLERKGLLSIGPAPHHGRAKAITLSSAGADLLQRAAPLWKMAHDRVSVLLGQRTTVTLAKGLDLSLEKFGDTRATGASADG